MNDLVTLVLLLTGIYLITGGQGWAEEALNCGVCQFHGCPQLISSYRPDAIEQGVGKR